MIKLKDNLYAKNAFNSIFFFRDPRDCEKKHLDERAHAAGYLLIAKRFGVLRLVAAFRLHRLVDALTG